MPLPTPPDSPLTSDARFDARLDRIGQRAELLALDLGDILAEFAENTTDPDDIDRLRAALDTLTGTPLASILDALPAGTSSGISPDVAATLKVNGSIRAGSLEVGPTIHIDPTVPGNYRLVPDGDGHFRAHRVDDEDLVPGGDELRVDDLPAVHVLGDRRGRVGEVDRVALRLGLQGKNLGERLADREQAVLGHQDSSSVVPGVAPSGDDATVEVTGDTARVDSSPRRVAGTHAPIQPPYTLYTLTVEPTFGLVTVVESELDGTLIRSQGLRPSQARDLAAWLIEAADQAEAVTR